MNQAHPPAEDRPHPATSALRDRIDELELIISSLTVFALFSLPGWLFEAFANNYTHLSVPMVAGSQFGITIITGLCYVLGSCFVLHLLVRAYWVGLIGLQSVFPGGIDWTHTPGIGPLTRERYKSTLPDLGQAIARADRIASSLFAVISLITLATLWIAVLLAVVLAIAGQVGARFGMTNRSMLIASFAMIVLFVGLPGLVWLLDSVIARNWPGVRKHRGFTSVVHALNRAVALLFPQRLIMPVQLTLQSNTRPRVFKVMAFIGAVAMVLIGNLRIAGWTRFTISDEFNYLNDAIVRPKLRSTHYENLRTGSDRLRPWPIIPGFEQSGAFLPLFLPYHPLRDNPILDRSCVAPTGTAAAVSCVRRLWAIRLNDTNIDLDGFVPTERGDLRMRGLTGLVSLAGLPPGMHELIITWNPDGFVDGQAVDDRYENPTLEFHIPFAFIPGYEMGVPDQSGLHDQSENAPESTPDEAQ